jgi:hypothetical protein
MNAMEEKHLTIETKIDGRTIDVHPINDPFLHNTTTYELSILDRIKLLFHGRVVFDVRIRGDEEAIRHWFRTDRLPRYEDGSAQVAASGQRSPPPDGTEH